MLFFQKIKQFAKPAKQNQTDFYSQSKFSIKIFFIYRQGRSVLFRNKDINFLIYQITSLRLDIV